MVVTVYKDKCNGFEECPRNGPCIEVCALDAIENVNGQPFILEEVCSECGLCVMNCPKGALSK